jgi:hypothetical protein
MNLLSGLIFLRLGGFVRYIYGTAIRKLGLSDAPYYSLKEYIHGSERPEDEHWDKGGTHEFVNRVVGMISAGAILLAIIYLDRLFSLLFAI